MHYLHTMIRVSNLDETLHFFCDLLGMIEISRKSSDKGRFTLVFLAAPGDETRAREDRAPMVELISRKALPNVPVNNSALATGILATSDRLTPELIKIRTIGMVKISTNPALKTVLLDSLKASPSARVGFLVCTKAAIKALINNRPPGKYKGLKPALISASPKIVLKSSVALLSKSLKSANILEHTSNSATSK